MTIFPPSPFSKKGVTAVRSPMGRSVFIAAPPWDGPAESL